MSEVQIRKATPADAAGISAIWRVIAEERIHSAVIQPWTVEQQRRYIESLSPREAIHAAVDSGGEIVAFQCLDLWSPILQAMAHVGQLGTFVLPRARKTGVGRRLWGATLAFARDAGYRKLVIQVRGSNAAAQSFYRSIGFAGCGRLTRQVIIDGVEDDEVLMELFL